MPSPDFETSLEPSTDVDISDWLIILPYMSLAPGKGREINHQTPLDRTPPPGRPVGPSHPQIIRDNRRNGGHR